MELVKQPDIMPENQLVAMPTIEDAWQQLPIEKRQVATDCVKIVKEVLAIMSENVAQRKAIEILILRMDTKTNVDAALIEIAEKLGRDGKLPSYSSINRWVKKYRSGGLVALAPAHKGSTRKESNWEVRAMRLYASPSKPSMPAVARKLRLEGIDVSDSQVRRYLNSLPADQGTMSRGRLGKRLFDNTQKTYKHRHTDDLPVGACFQGDGHTIDVYLQHPNGNKPWRAELTLWLDVASRYVVGWYLSEAESAHSTLFALSYAILNHDHIPAILHIDNGSGYKNKMMSDESTGFYARLGIDIMHARPYNAKAKGHVERFFGTMERDFNKWYPSYCGEDMAEEPLQLLLKQHKKGEATLPSKEQWIAEFSEWIEQYHNTKHSGLNGKTPNQLWATLERHSVELKSTAIFWPRTQRTVKRQAITLDGREYMSPELIQYNNKKVTVEYNLHNDRGVRVLDSKDRWICDAILVTKQAYLPASRLEEATQNRLKAQIKRLNVHAQEKSDRAGLSITHENVLDSIKELGESGTPTSLTHHSEAETTFKTSDKKTDSTISIDPYDTNY